MKKLKAWTQRVQQFKKDFENPIELKDGRTLFTKNNGFDHFVRSAKGVDTPVTLEYYLKSKKHRV